MKKFWIFLAFCFGLSWLSAALFYFLGGDYASIGGSLFASGYMFMPLISVVLTQLVTGETPFNGCGISFKVNWWWLVAVLSMQVIVLLSLPASALMPGVAISTDTPILTQSVEQMEAQGLPIGPWGLLIITLFSGFVAACTINALFAFGEEVAWRGFLSRILNDLGFWKKSLLVGAIWGLWHAPIILMGHNYPTHPVAGVFMMIAFCTLLAPLMQFVRDRAKSVIAAAMMHGSLNAVARLAIIYLSGYNEILCGCTGIAGFAIFAILDIVIFLCTRKKQLG